MKILQIFPGKIWGGAEQYVLDLGMGLRERGHEVTYACYKGSRVADQLVKKGVEFKTFTTCNLSFGGCGLGLTDMMVGQEVVHIHSPKFLRNVRHGLDALKSRAKLVMTKHDIHKMKVFKPFRKKYDRLDALVCTSYFLRNKWKEANRWFSDDKCRVVPNSIPDYEPEDVESLRDKYCIPAGEKLLLFSGRIRKSKGCEVLVRALGTLWRDDWHAVFIGNDYPAGYNDQLRKLGKKYGIEARLHFYGFSENARSLMRQADIGVSPSIVSESCGLTNLEYMQVGVCVVASSSGAQTEYLSDGVNGFIVTPGDQDELACVIGNLLDNEELRVATAASGKERFERDLAYGKFLDKIGIFS